MLLCAFSSVFALSVPLTVTYKEEIGFGENSLASTTLSATVQLSNPQTGASFIVSQDELTVGKQQARGGGGVVFHGDTAGSIRTWAIYSLSASGAQLGEPEIIDVLFDENGNGAMVSKESGTVVSSLTVKARQRELGFADVDIVRNQKVFREAAYIGIIELSNTVAEADMYTDPDMEIMDAGVFASFQGLGLQAIVLLDHHQVQLSGTLEVSGLGVSSSGEVESGAELQWDISFYDGGNLTTCQSKDPASCKEASPIPVGSISYLSAIGAVKKNKTTTPKVQLKPQDITYDIWDAGMVFSVEGDVGNLELAALLSIPSTKKTAEAIALGPSGRGIEARDLYQNDDGGGDDDDSTPIVDIFIDTDCEDCGDYDFAVPNPSQPWTYIADELIDVAVYDSGGGLVAVHTCTLAPTAKTLAGTASKATLVGECTSTEDTEVLRLRATVGPLGGSRWSVDMAGEAFVAERSETTCSKGGSCTTQTTSVIDGHIELSVRGTPFFSKPLAVTTTEFALPFTFDSDIQGAEADLLVEFEDPTRVISWSVVNGIAYGYEGEKLIYTIDPEGLNLEATGLYQLSGGSSWSMMPEPQSVTTGRSKNRVRNNAN